MTEAAHVGPRVLIVEDHELLAQSLAFALRADGMEVANAQVATHEDILTAAREHAPDVVLLDLEIGGDVGSTLGLIPDLQATGSRVVMVTGVTDPERLAECVEAGAIGLVSKASPFEILLESLREAIELGTLISPGQRDELMAELRRQRVQRREQEALFGRLTAREAAILGHLMEGLSAEAISQESYVSVATVRSQIRSVLMKLEVNSQLAAVALARRAGWEPDTD